MANNSFFNRLTDGFGDLSSGVRDFSNEVNERSRSMNMRLIEMAQENTAHSIQAAKAVIEAKDLSEAIQAQRTFVQDGFSRSAAQSREIVELLSDATVAAFTPLRTAVDNARSAD